jgi:hypothetical protein
MESIVINGDDLHQRIFVGTSGENVHLSMMVVGGSCYMSIDRDEAKKMIKALEQAIQQAIKDSYDWDYEAREEARLDAAYDARYASEDE